ncbi:MAG: class I SAM-dependent methyltransferase [Actinobacteria bacterium]|nr:class I SAM-dependent methyltransferase [Actinomycetota bacterium]
MLKGLSYDLLSRSFERGPGARVRRRLLDGARGEILEIGAGTGANLAHYPAAVTRLVLTEPDRGMAARLGRKLAQAQAPVELVRAPAASLPFPDASFDVVVSTLVLCTVPDPDDALAEIRRVLRADGSFLFLEHVRSSDPRRARWQDRLERPWGLLAGGCHPNRPSVERVRAAGFAVDTIEAGEMPGFPRIVRPYVAGAASPNAPGTGVRAAERLRPIGRIPG